MNVMDPYRDCLTCGRRSYHPRDIQERYCAACGFEDDIALIAELDAIHISAPNPLKDSS